MKKSLFLLTFFIVSLTKLAAQCTIQSCTPTGVWCTTPALNSALPSATETMTYSTVIQISLASDAAGNTINSGTITAVTGLPTGLSYSTNPTNGVISGGGSGCILLAGTPSNGSAGNYTITVNMSISSSFGLIPATFNWSLAVVSTAGISSTSNYSGMLVTPNPATSQLNLAADFHFQKVNVFDALGSLAFSNETSSVNKTSVDLSKLNPGIYFIQVTDGRRSITRKFIKE